MVIQWYSCERLVFNPTNKKKVIGENVDNANDSCPLDKGVDRTCLYWLHKVPAVYERDKCHWHFLNLT